MSLSVLNPGVKTEHEVEGSKKQGKISHRAHEHELKVFHELIKQLGKQILLGVIKHNPCITNC